MSTKYFLKLAQLVCELIVDLVMTLNKYYVVAVVHVGSVWLFVLLVFLQDHLCVWLWGLAIFTFSCDLKHSSVYTVCVYVHVFSTDDPCFCSQNPVQEWGEEMEDGAVYGVTLRREPVPSSANATEGSPCSGFVQYRTCKVRRLKAATLDLLVNHLLDLGCQEQDYSRIFLSTYRTFTNPTKLIELLFQRYRCLLYMQSWLLCCLRIFSSVVSTWWSSGLLPALM